MSVLVKNDKQEYFLYTKGADEILYERLSDTEKSIYKKLETKINDISS